MSTTNKSNDVIGTMGEWFDKFPPLPKGGRDTLARIAPILSLIFGILGILVGISGLGLLTVLSPFAYMAGVPNYGTGVIAALIYLVASVILLMSYPGLNAKKYKGWKLLFWSEAVSFIGGLVSMAFISTIIWGIIAFYLIFQIRSYFK